MAKSQADDLYDRLRVDGLRKRVARELSEGLSNGGPSKTASDRIADLRKLVADLEDRAEGGPAKRDAEAERATRREAVKRKAGKPRARRS